MNPKDKSAFATGIILAAEDNQLPEEVEILQENSWKDAPGRPDLTISASDIDEYVANFKAKKRAGVPIDIEHRESKVFGEQASGWVQDVYSKIKANGKNALFIKPEWNALGKELVGDKRFRFVSAEFIPASLGGVQDAEGKGLLKNVLKAVTITNKPWMKDLPALMASEDSAESTSGLTLQVSQAIINSNEGAKPVNLDAIRGKVAADLTADEKTFAVEHKGELSSAEQIKLGLAEAPKAEVTATETMTTIKASELEELRTKAAKADGLEQRMTNLETAANAGVKASEELALTKANAVVDKQIERGAIKSDAREFWSGQLVKANEEDFKTLETQLNELPSNPVIGTKAIGDNKAGDIGGGATKQLITKAEELVKANEGLSFDKALLQARAENTVLASEADAENNNGEVK